MKLLSFALLIWMGVACGPQKKHTKNDKSPVDDVTSLPSIPSDGDNEKIGETPQVIIEQIKSGSIDKEEGLQAIGIIINKNEFPDSEELKALVGELSDIHGSIEDNLELLLGLSRATTDSFDIDGLNSIFLSLSVNPLQYSKSMDVLLMHFLNLVIGNIQYTETKVGTTEDIVSYFREKIFLLLQNNEDPTRLFNQYSLLQISVPEKVDFVFADLFGDIKLAPNDPYLSQMLYANLLREHNLRTGINSFDISTVNIFRSTYHNSLWAIKAAEQNEILLNKSLSIISYYFALFDSVDKIEPSLKKDWINFIDNRTIDISSSILSLIISKMKSGSVSEIQHDAIHPYLKIYLNKASLELQKRAWYFQSVLLGDFEDFENVFFNEIRDFCEKDISQKSAGKSYLRNFYNVEIKKHFLEIQSISYGVVEKTDDSRIKVYKSLLSDLLRSLNYFYDKAYTLADLYSSGFSSGLYRELEADYLESRTGTFKKNYCKKSTSNCETLKLSPGIFMSPLAANENGYNLELFGESIYFHPLSMIYAPGMNVYLNFEKIQNAWIDVSGKDGVFTAREKDHIEITVPSIRYRVASKHKKHKPGMDKYIWRLSGKLSKVPDQIASGSGSNSGRIEINQSYKGVMVGIPLLVSQGGSGANGGKGLSSRLKKKVKVYTGAHKKRKRNIGNSQLYKVQIFQKGTCLSKLSYEEFTQILVWGYSGSNRQATFTIIGGESNAKSISKKLNKSRGGRGGNGGNAKRVFVRSGLKHEFEHLLLNQIIAPGNPGKGGPAGDCGYGKGNDYRGVNGKAGVIID